MSFSERALDVTFEAGEDLSSKQFFFVSVATDGQVTSTGDGATAVGVVQNDPDAAGKAATVCIGGKCKVICGGSVTAGDDLASDAAGEAVSATTTGDVILGVALESGSDGEIISMVFQPRGTAS